MEKDNKTAPHAGHRARMLDKLANGPLSDYEYLEILLFNAVPRRNTNDLAHRLLSRFGTVQALFCAEFDELRSVDGIGDSVAAYLHCIGKFYSAYADKKDDRYCGKYDPKRFVSYLRNLPSYPKEEKLDILLLDENGYLLTKRSFEGGVSRVLLAPETLTDFLTKYHPAGVVIAHNHPQGNPTPSDKDEEMTRKCQLLCAGHNVVLCDHIIYAKGGVFSYYASGKLQDISKEYSLDNVVQILQ